MTHPPRVGVGVLVVRDDRVLLLRWINAHGVGNWSPPGGHLELGEPPEDCAIHETKEETGLDIGEVHFLAITNSYIDSRISIFHPLSNEQMRKNDQRCLE